MRNFGLTKQQAESAVKSAPSQSKSYTAQDTSPSRERELRARPYPQQQSTRDSVPLLEGLTQAGGGLRDLVSGFFGSVGASADVLSGNEPLVNLSGGPDYRSDIEQRQRQMGSGARDIASGSGQAALGSMMEVDRFTGAPIRGALLNPSNPVSGAVEGFRDPIQAQLRNMGGIRSLPDNDIALGLSPRDVVGGVADMFADVGAAGEIAGGFRGGRAVARSLKDLPVGMSIKNVGDDAADPLLDAAKMEVRRALADEQAIRDAGIAEREITESVQRSFGGRDELLAEGRRRGLSGKDLSEYADQALERGPRRSTYAGPLEVDNAAVGRLYDVINNRLSGTTNKQATTALGKLVDGLGVQPAEARLLKDLFGGDFVDDLIKRNGDVGVNRSYLNNIPRRGAPNVQTKGPKAPPSAGAPRPISRTPAARNALSQMTARDRKMAESAADAIRAEQQAAREAGQQFNQLRSRIAPEGGQGTYRPSAKPPPTTNAVRGNIASRNAAETAEQQRLLAQAERQRQQNFNQLRSRLPNPGGRGTITPSSTAPNVRSIAAQARNRAAERANAIKPKPNRPSSFWERFTDIINIPRTLSSSFDISAPYRQGAILSARNPKEFYGSWGPMLNSARSKDVARAFHVKHTTGPMATVRDRAGMFLSDAEGALSVREEAYMSRLASRVPGIDASGRAYSTFLNELRTSFFDKNYERLAQSGLKGADLDKAAQDLAKFTNWATGRGDMPAGKLTQILNGLFFSPRLLASRFQTIKATLPRQLGGLENDVVRQIARENVATWVGQNMAVLSMLAVAAPAVSGDRVSVELDPRSSDFMRLRIGPTRIDPWAGFGPIATTLARMITGERVTSGGQVVDAPDRLATSLGFLEGKLSPSGGVLVDILSGETYDQGDIESLGDLGQVTLDRLIPINAQEILEAWEEAAGTEGHTDTLSSIDDNPAALAEGIARSIPGFVGFGVNTYSSPYENEMDIKNSIVERNFDELGIIPETMGGFTMRGEPTSGAQTSFARLEAELGPQVAEQRILDLATPEEQEELRSIFADRRESLNERAADGDLQASWSLISHGSMDGITDLSEQYRRGEIDGDQFRTEVAEIKEAARRTRQSAQYDELRNRESSNPIQQDTNDYFSYVFDGAKAEVGNENTPEYYEAVDRRENEYISEIGPERYRLIEDNLYTTAGIDIPQEYRVLQGTKLALARTGFYDIRDQAWEAITQAAPELAAFETEREFREAMRAQLETAARASLRKSGTKLSEDALQQLIDNKLGGLKPIRTLGEVVNALETQWAQSNSIPVEELGGETLADLAARFGYMSIAQSQMAPFIR
jgi:hypothetical protein